MTDKIPFYETKINHPLYTKSSKLTIAGLSLLLTVGFNVKTFLDEKIYYDSMVSSQEKKEHAEMIMSDFDNSLPIFREFVKTGYNLAAKRSLVE